jgi:hypothetical protein
MQISLRSQLIAGTAAVVGASAIAMTPVTAAQVNLPSLKVPSAAQVALTGFDSPITELIDTLSWVNYDLFNGDPANIDANYSWEPFAGMLPEFIYTALPILSQMGYNGADYINTTLDAVGFSAYTLSEAVWNLPGALITATKQLFSGDFSGAVATLTNATWVPIKDAISSVVGSGTYLVSGVVTNITNTLAALPAIAKGLANTTIGTVKASINAIVEITKQTFAALGGGNFELAWNTVVDGLFGPVGADGSVLTSLPGVLESMSIGPGLIPLGPGNGYAPAPSFRMWGEQSQLTIANGLGATWPAASVAAPKSAAAKASRVAAPVAAVTAAPAAEVAAGDNNAAAAETGAAAVSHPVAGSDAGSAPDAGASAADSAAPSARAGAATPKAAKHGVSRKAAAKAAAAD